MKKKFDFHVKDDLFMRTIEENDIEYLRILRNKNKDFFLYSESIEREQQEEWFRSYVKKENDYMFLVYKKYGGNELPIGTVALYDIDFIKRNCEFGRIMIDRDKRLERGIGTLVTKRLLVFAKEEFQINNVRLEVYENNIPALKTYVKSGFVRVGERCIKDKNVILMEVQLD